MHVIRGPIWRDGEFRDGWVSIRDGRIEGFGTGVPPARPVASGVVLPSFVNAHTHVGDFLARGRVPDGLTLEEAVAPPHGVKHRLLAAASREELVASVRAACREAFEAGTHAVFDFREGGLDGVRALREGAAGTGVEPVALARPGRPDEGVPELAEAADGIGLSALRDVPLEDARRLSQEARRAGKRFALHWSESVRESVDDALDLEPDFVVHAVAATVPDVERLADAGVPIVACPRSNARLLRSLPNVRAWLDAGVPVALGSDNAMFQSVSLLDELRFARKALPDVRPVELVRMAVDTPRERLSTPRPLGGTREGDPADLVVLRAVGNDPLAAVFDERATVVHRATPPAA